MLKEYCDNKGYLKIEEDLINVLYKTNNNVVILIDKTNNNVEVFKYVKGIIHTTGKTVIKNLKLLKTTIEKIENSGL